MRKLIPIELPCKLDIGCGHGKITGFVGMDHLDFGQEIVWDINNGIPLPDNSVSALHASHFMEHLENKELTNFFSEVIRVCPTGTKVTLIVPHADTIEAHYLCHYSLWDESKIAGIIKDSPNLELESTERDGIHFTMNIKVKK